MNPMLLLVAALLGVVMLAGLGYAFVGGGDSSAKAVKRAQALNGQSKAERSRVARQGGGQTLTTEQRRKQIQAQLKEAERKNRKNQLTMEARLRHAGLTTSVRTFWIISAGVGVGVGLVAMVLSQPPLIALGVGAIAGLGLPRWVVGFLAGRRTKKFTSAFADAVDIIVRGVKSGLPVHDCLKIIGRECPAPLGPEFTRLVENLGMGLTFDQALEKMYERMPTPELRFFAIVMSIQQKAGGNLAEALGNLSAVLRSRKLMREKIKAMSSEATASAGIIGSLPPGVMIIVGLTTPSYMALMFTDPRGHLMLLGGGMWMGLGIFVMKKMISFKI
jgi:tight adherence protein B